MIYKFVWCAVCGSLLAGCTYSKPGTVKECAVDEYDGFQSEASVRLSDDGILNPIDICVVGSGIYVTNGDASAPQLFLYDDSLSLVANGFPLGMGPDDIMEVTSMRRNGDELHLYDSRLGKIVAVEVADGSLRGTDVIAGLNLKDDVVAIGDDALLVANVAMSHSYEIFDSLGCRIGESDYFPPKPQAVSDFAHSLACTGSLAWQPSRGRFARSVVYDGGVDFFSVDNNVPMHVSRYSVFDMDYKMLHQGGDLPVANDETRVGYTKVACSDQYFYALFSPDKAWDNPEGIGRELHVFSSEGELVAKLLFPHALGNFDVSANGEMLVALEQSGDSEEYLLSKFDLSDIIR